VSPSEAAQKSIVASGSLWDGKVDAVGPEEHLRAPPRRLPVAEVAVPGAAGILPAPWIVADASGWESNCHYMEIHMKRLIRGSCGTVNGTACTSRCPWRQRQSCPRCIKNSGGDTRIVGPNQSCVSNEYAKHWAITGPAGSTGPMGATGATGPTGTPGATGPQGAAGTNGAPGTNGVDGAPEAKGEQGVAGTNGIDGATGPQGERGVAGADGAPGTNGSNGADGAPGTNGSNGVAGPIGPQGAPVTPGTNGVDGQKGDTGAQGAQGVAGPTGPQGPPGTC
jgi:collagen triple helix repeat protein